jgi:multidrug efflux pump subunit AcrA (membrane-fusion protein)
MKRNIYLIFIAVIIIAALAYTFIDKDGGQETSLKAEVIRGNFEVVVTTTGELEAIHSNKISGPSGLRPYNIYNLKILDIVADGKIVDSGDWVADIDRTPIQNKINDLKTEMEKFETQLTKARIDTSIEMRAARSEILNLEWAVEENKLKVEQSIYEPKATQRQLEISLDKSVRSLEQAKKNKELKEQKAQANVSEAMANYTMTAQKFESIQKISNQFTIYAPKNGMVNYYSTWRGKREAGSEFDVWDNTVALLPDLSQMKTKTFVNEVDISKVKVGQPVTVVIDAFPDNEYEGVVTSVANIGQTIRSSSAKVFEVIIQLNESDDIMKPAMTTQNRILTDSFEDVLQIPSEALYSNDSISYVYTKGKRYQVELGVSNENYIIVNKGLEEGDEVLLTEPSNPESYKLVLLK